MKQSRSEIPRIPDYDARWKTVVEQFPEQTLERFFPDLATQRDFSKPISFKEKELQKIFADWKKKGWTLADKLMLVPLKNGKEKLVLIHFDIHRSHDSMFKKLMWRRGYRIMDKYPDHDFTALAIYIGAQVPPEPNCYTYEFSGTKFSYTYNVCIVKDEDEEKLLASNNPLDIAILAMWYILKAGDDVNLLAQYKRNLARLCFQKGFPSQVTRNLLIFVGFTIALPEEEEKLFINEIMPIMEERRIPLVELNPIVAQLFEVDLYGKTLKKRDAERDAERDAARDAVRVVRLFQEGMNAERIAFVMEMDEEVVHQIISDFENKSEKGE